MTDQEYMRIALDLSHEGEGWVNPNPLVGAIVVADDEIVGRGYHHRFGEPHAEVFALDEAGTRAQRATMYVTLEPCSHHGKTPPCTERIIAAGIRRVVMAVSDPNPLVNGRGIEALRASGIGVTVGVLEAEARQANEIFFKYIQTGLPFVELKLAQSMDGKIATRTGDSKWISGEESRVAVHRLRRRLAAILVGVQTVIADDPLLTVRHVTGPNPVRVVLDGHGRIPLTAKLLHDGGRTVVATATMGGDKEKALLDLDVEVWRLPRNGDRIDLRALLQRLGEAQIDSLLVEGGGETAASFLEVNLVDKVSLFIAPIIIGGRDAVPAVGGSGSERVADALHLARVSVSHCGTDMMVVGYPKRRGR